jgi:centromere protein B
MDNKGKWKLFTISDKINILAQVDAHTDTHVELASRLRLSVSTLNTIVKNHEEIERMYIQCGPFTKPWKSLKRLPLEKLESALSSWFKQARENNASIDGNHLKEKALHIAAHLGIANFSASNRWINRFKRRANIVYKTLSSESRSVDPETVEDWKNY